MLQVYLGGILMVLGMFALLASPIIGGIMLAAGYGLYSTTSKATRADAESTFWGFAVLCMVVVGVAALLS
ncbi:hypothetical protein [Pseudomonas paralcaligenes]|uniref:hypothetical protein n=1 Tax=Pseudomonas paralcaligenes TaxID=2772558 RepID=UPI001C80DFFA|nr:hypothetical protein [Pseudomonas paralcaligenes]